MREFSLIGKVLYSFAIGPSAFLRHMLQGSFGAAFRISYDKACDSGRGGSPPPISSVAAGCRPPLTCVVKRVDIERKSFKLIMRESWFLQQLKHPNIASLLHQYMSPNSAPDDRNPTSYLIQEDCGENLMTYLRNRMIDSSEHDLKVVPVETIERVLEGLLSALACLERYGIIHRDIKEDNCLIFGQEPHITAKLIDFGLAKKFDKDHATAAAWQVDHSVAGSSASVVAHTTGAAFDGNPDDQSKLFNSKQQYAPETFGVAGKRGFTHKSDLWAAGTMILWPMLFWACPDNLKKNKYNAHGQIVNLFASRKFPFPPSYDKHPEQFSQADLHKLIKDKLVDKFQDSQRQSRFKKICDILAKMCAFEHFSGGNTLLPLT
jgi:serine/threonine protein kinase